LMGCRHLGDLFMMGNPCQVHYNPLPCVWARARNPPFSSNVSVWAAASRCCRARFCQQMDWEAGFEHYMIHRLPQLKCLDGKDVTKV
jgi:hypothetical protein